MKEQNSIQTGMYVRVLENLEKTDRRWTVVEGMSEMRGRVFKVESTRSGGVSINDFYFHPDDLKVINSEKTSKDKQEFHFDVSELIM